MLKREDGEVFPELRLLLKPTAVRMQEKKVDFLEMLLLTEKGI